MNANFENHEPNRADELSDRLLDRALAEVIGGETPPDLSSLILAARRPGLAAANVSEAGAGGRRVGRRFWVTLAVAAMLLVAAVPLVQQSSLHVQPQIAGSTVREKIDGQDANFDAVTQQVQSTVQTESWAERKDKEEVLRNSQPTPPGPNSPGNSTADNSGPVIFSGDDPTAKAIGLALAGRTNPTGTTEVNVAPQAPGASLPAPDGSALVIPGDSQAVQGRSLNGLSATQLAAERGLLEPVQIQYLEGANLVIIRGREEDAAKVLKTIEQMEQTKSEQTGQGSPADFRYRNQITGEINQPNGPTSVKQFPKFTSELDVPFRQNSFDLTPSDSKSMNGNPGQGNGAMPFPDQGVTGPGPGQIAAAGKPVVTWEFEDRKDRYGLDDAEMTARPEIITRRIAAEIRPNKETPLGTGSGPSGDRYVKIYENPFFKAEGKAVLSTFSIDVDTASYTNVRRFLLQENTLPPPDAVRLEELVNYFKYDYAPPKMFDGEDKAGPPAPFAAHLEVAGCPWQPEHRLVRIGIKGQEIDRRERPKSNLVFLVDVSGSMSEASKLPLVVDGLRELARELGENDRVAIVVYAQQVGLVLPSTKGTDQATILGALGQLRSGGSTAGGAGIQLAYQVAEDNFIKGGTNRVILCTDGDFNVGVTNTAELQTLVEKKAKDTGVFLSAFGFGRGNLNDQMMEAIADHGNGNYHYVDSLKEARRVFVEEMSGTLVTIAKDVKIQVEFNPKQVAGYRLLGYENRMLQNEDFNDDKKDAGEIGAGHTVTALYEIVPAGKPVDLPGVDPLKYQQPESADRSRLSTEKGEASPQDAAKPVDISRELLTLKMKYKRPDAEKSEEALSWPLVDEGKKFAAASRDFQFASAVAGFGMLLRGSQYKGNLTYAAAIELAQGGIGRDEQGYRRELVEMIGKAKQLRGE